MMRLIKVLALLLTAFWGTQAMAHREDKAIENTLDAFHLAASQADFDSYFGLFHPTAVFIGTDASERWDLTAFKAYAKPHFAAGKGWTYTATTRHVQVADDGKLAWFDEILKHARYGVCRGSGVLILDGSQWKIAQYHLTIPVPNALALTLVDLIAQDAGAKAKPKAETKPKK